MDSTLLKTLGSPGRWGERAINAPGGGISPWRGARPANSRVTLKGVVLGTESSYGADSNGFRSGFA